MRARPRRIVIGALVIGALAALAVSAPQAHEIPVLPAGEALARLPTPAYFKDSGRQQLSRSLGSVGREARTEDSAPGAIESPVDVISIDATKLRAPVMPAPRGDVLHIGEAGPTAGPLTLELAGERFELAWIAEISETSSIMRHESLQVRGVPGAYARFTVSADDIVGTIVTPQAIYRITPYGAGRQAVFRTPAGPAARYQRKLRDDSPAARLERRHVQVERVAEIQPYYAFVSDPGRFLSIRGGQLGRLSSNIDEAAVLAYLQSFDALLHLPDGTQTRLEAVKTFADRKQIVFRQLIAGIPLRGDSELDTDAQGAVTAITAEFVDPQTATPVAIAQGEARQIAVKAIENKLGMALREVELIQPTELYYDFVAVVQKTMPIYSFYMTAKHSRGSWLVFVNATNGDAWIAENPQNVARNR